MGLISVPLLLAILLLFTAQLWLPAIGHWLAQPPHPGPVDAIVVLSGGGPERVLYGVQLYQQGFAPELWLTGDAPLPQMLSFTDGRFARDLALGQGVPAEVIRLLATTSTWEDGRETVTLARHAGLRSILVVTNWYHSRRALCVIRQRFVDGTITVYYLAPPAATYGPDNWWQLEDGLVAVVNEYIKWGFYWLHYGLSSWEC